jgi:imidazolonepropionase-like amidohydrolase
MWETGKYLSNATIGFEQGVITFLEENPSFKTDETMGKVIDCSGKHIYPGLIAPATILGLTEIESVRATNDMYETGQFNPDARAAIAYNTDSRVTPTVRSNGVLICTSGAARRRAVRHLSFGAIGRLELGRCFGERRWRVAQLAELGELYWLVGRAGRSKSKQRLWQTSRANQRLL